MRFFHPLALLALPLALGACAGTPGSGVDGRKFLESTQGPSVPTVGGTLLKSAQDAEKAGQYAQAVQLYKQLVDQSPENEAYLIGYGEALRRTGKYDASIATFDRALKVNASSAAALEGKGLSQMGKGNFDEAAKLLADTLRAEPTRWRTLNALGILFTVKNMQVEAQQYFREALKQNTNNPSVLNNMGLSQALDRRFVSAIGTLTQASAQVRGKGKNERQHIDLNLALVYAASGDLQSAKNIAGQYLSGPALDNNMGIYAHLAKDDQLAKTYLNMALTESKGYYARAWENLDALSADRPIAPAAAPAPKELPAAPTSATTKPAAPVTLKESEPAPAVTPEATPEPAAQTAEAPSAAPAEPEKTESSFSPFSWLKRAAAARPEETPPEKIGGTVLNSRTESAPPVAEKTEEKKEPEAPVASPAPEPDASGLDPLLTGNEALPAAENVPTEEPAKNPVSNFFGKLFKGE